MDRQPTARSARDALTQAGAQRLADSLQRKWAAMGYPDVVFRVEQCEIADPERHERVYQVRSNLTGREGA